jgi:hypothetical protein
MQGKGDRQLKTGESTNFFHKVWGKSWLSEKLSAFKETIWNVKSVSKTRMLLFITSNYSVKLRFSHENSAGSKNMKIPVWRVKSWDVCSKSSTRFGVMNEYCTVRCDECILHCPVWRMNSALFGVMDEWCTVRCDEWILHYLMWRMNTVLPGMMNV